MQRQVITTIRTNSWESDSLVWTATFWGQWPAARRGQTQRLGWGTQCSWDPSRGVAQWVWSSLSVWWASVQTAWVENKWWTLMYLLVVQSPRLAHKHTCTLACTGYQGYIHSYRLTTWLLKIMPTGAYSRDYGTLYNIMPLVIFNT